MAFVVTRFFSPMVAALGQDWTFWIFSMFISAVSAFALFFVPETKGKTLEDIQVGVILGKPRPRGIPGVNEIRVKDNNFEITFA